MPGVQEIGGQMPDPGQILLSGHTVTPGVQLVTSLDPPLHLWVLALQIGQGWMPVEPVGLLSATHEPTTPPQFASVVQTRPRLLGSGVRGPHRLNMISPSPYVAAASGRVRFDAPLLHASVPLAFVAIELRTQALSAVLFVLTTGTGGP